MEQVHVITKDTIIADVVKRYPEAVGILQSYGLQCLGCHVNIVESIENGAKGHGMTDEQIREMLTEVNKVLRPKEESVEEDSGNKKVFFTESAVKKIKSLSKDENSKILRVEVALGGCSGSRYNMRFVSSVESGDTVIEKGEVTIVLDQESLNALDGTNVDYIDTLNESGFKFDNPNAQSTCGCGSSFK